MRRVLVAVVASALFALSALTPASAHSTAGKLDLVVVKAPVAPDGTSAGAQLDFVVHFRDLDPAVPGVGMKDGATITIELDEAFDLTGNQGVGQPGGPPAIILQGWPQSPRVPFPHTTDVVGNTITLRLTDDWDTSTFGPGPKSVHLAMLASSNPARSGRYEIDLTIRPDPSSGQTLGGHGHVQIIPGVRPSVNVVSLFSGPGPPPLFNPVHQELSPGEAGRVVGMYLWERGGSAAVGIDVQRTNAHHARLVQDGRTVGQVHIDAPAGARDHVLVSEGPSMEGPAFVTGVPTGILRTTFVPDPAVAGHYSVTFAMNGGNSQTMHYTVSD